MHRDLSRVFGYLKPTAVRRIEKDLTGMLDDDGIDLRGANPGGIGLRLGGVFGSNLMPEVDRRAK